MSDPAEFSSVTLPEAVSPLSALAFFAELMLLITGATAAARLADSLTVSVIAGIVTVILLAVLWGVWLAPRSARRLIGLVRLGAKVALVALVALLLGIGGLVVWAGVFFVICGGVFVLGELRNAVG